MGGGREGGTDGGTDGGSDGGHAGDEGTTGEGDICDVPRDVVECCRVVFFRRLIRGLDKTTLPHRIATSADSGNGSNPGLRMPPGPPARRSDEGSASHGGSRVSSGSISRFGRVPMYCGSTSMLGGVRGPRESGSARGGGGWYTLHCSPVEIMSPTKPSSVSERPLKEGEGR